MAKDLILGTATGAQFLAAALPFAASARRQHPDADIVLLSDPEVPADLGRAMDRLGVRLWPVRCQAYDVDFHIQNRRFREYFRYLLEHSYRRVFLSDTRDAYFQGNVFSAFASDGDWIAFFQETPGYKIGSEKFNRTWIHHIFGEETLRRMADETVVCSGTTLGTGPAILEYLALMTTLEETHRALRAVPSDQGQHNYLIWKKLMRVPQFVFPQENPIVYTVFVDDAYRITEQGDVLTTSGIRAAVLHQYDRAQDIALAYRARILGELAGFGLVLAE